MKIKKACHSKFSDQILNALGDMLLAGLSAGNVYDMGKGLGKVC